MLLLLSAVGIALIISKYSQIDLNKSQIFISIVLLLNYTYFSAVDMMDRKWVIIAHILFLFIFMITILFCLKSTPPLAARLSNILSFFAICLVLVSSVNLGYSVISDNMILNNTRFNQEFEAQFQKILTENLTTDLNTRDFYFIIIDRYPGEDILNSEFGFKNDLFINNLTAMGFVVMKKSRSNYGATAYSLPSMVNMDYYNPWQSVENNKLGKFFKSQGFKFVFLPSTWSKTARNNYADIVLNPFPSNYNKTSEGIIFQEVMFFERTLLGKVYFKINELLNRKVYTIHEVDIEDWTKKRDQITERPFVLDAIKNLTIAPRIPGKKFVFIHIDSWEMIEERPNYIIKIKTMNDIIETMTKRIILDSRRDPVIVLLSDHGKKPSSEALGRNRSIFANYASYPNQSIDQNYVDSAWYPVNNFEAFYLPEGGNKYIYSGITPVNSMRMILNYYFNTSFPRDGDRSYWYSPDTGRLNEMMTLRYVTSDCTPDSRH